MSSACDTSCDKVVIDYSASEADFIGMKVGYSYGDYIEFFEDDGKTPLDITGDTFTWEVSNDGFATLITTLVLTGGILVGGLEISDTNRLNYLFGSPVTDTAGVYQSRVILNDPVWGNNEPVAAVKIVVKP
jgi:hypothetical protein